MDSALCWREGFLVLKSKYTWFSGLTVFCYDSGEFDFRYDWYLVLMAGSFLAFALSVTQTSSATYCSFLTLLSARMFLNFDGQSSIMPIRRFSFE